MSKKYKSKYNTNENFLKIPLVFSKIDSALYMLILVALTDLELIFCGSLPLKHLSKCFSTILVNYKAAPLEVMLEHYG